MLDLVMRLHLIPLFLDLKLDRRNCSCHSLPQHELNVLLDLVAKASNQVEYYAIMNNPGFVRSEPRCLIHRSVVISAIVVVDAVVVLATVVGVAVVIVDTVKSSGL